MDIILHTSVNIMVLLRRALIVLLIETLIPLGVVAQKDSRFEISVGVSTPRIDELKDSKLFYLGIESFEVYKDEPLSNLDEDTFSSTLYPCFSVQLSYDLSESGFFKKLDLVGYAGYHFAGVERYDIVNATSSKESARKLDILIGIRYNIVEREKFNLYTQFLAGNDILDDSGYWDYVYKSYGDDYNSIMQLTFLGFNWTLGNKEGKSRMGVMAELGYGQEYGASVVPIFPGVRVGLSYKF